MDVGFYNVIVHGIAFMALFTAFQTSGAFQATVLDDVLHQPNLGFTSLSIIYVVFACSNFISPPVVEKLGARIGMLGGACFYTLFIASFLKPMAWSILAASALLGIAAAVIWTAQGNFLTMNTTDMNRGKYSGIFWALLQSSSLIGNLLSYFVLPSGDITAHQAHFFYLILFGAASGGTLLFLLLRAPPASRPNALSATIENKNAPRPTIVESIVSTFKMLVSRDMLMLSFMIMYSGLELTFWSSKYPTMISGKLKPGPDLPSDFTPKATALSGIIVGAAEIFGGLVMGRLSDRIGRGWVVMCALFVHTAAYFLIFLNFVGGVFEPQLSLGLACSFLLGLGDSTVNTALYGLLAEKYSGSSIQAFALYKFFQSATAGIAFAYTGRVVLEWQLLILGVFLLLGSYFFVKVDALRFKSGYTQIS